LIKHKGWNLWINGGNLPMDYTLPKYAGCTTVAEITAKDANYLTNDIVNGVWTEHLPDLSNGERMFGSCTDLTSFNSDLSNLVEAEYMFTRCSKMTDFTSDLRSLTNGTGMFYCGGSIMY
jgi:hypothetical protein